MIRLTATRLAGGVRSENVAVTLKMAAARLEGRYLGFGSIVRHGAGFSSRHLAVLAWAHDSIFGCGRCRG